jgi:lysine-ketoglutarate reductase/saccharopine dehydrogenase-like protein (TIGR00300 family)
MDAMYLREAFQMEADLRSLQEIKEYVTSQGGYIQVISTTPLRFYVYALPEELEPLAVILESRGCARPNDARLVIMPSPADGVGPDDFYATSNCPTYVIAGGCWRPVERLRMDGCIVLKAGRAVCTILRDVKAGDEVVVGEGGIRLAVMHLPGHDDTEFGFMTGTVSSERQMPVIIRRIVVEMKRIHDAGGRIVFVLGPAIVHTGGVRAFSGIVEKGYVQALLSGNALAVHDIENALFGTSLGIDTTTGANAVGGHRHHLQAINRIRYHGSIRKAVEAGELTSGIMYTLIKRDIPFALAGSIRDDGPLPETEMDLIKAQRHYGELLDGADMAVMIGSMLHSIGAGNMLSAGCRIICVDINHAAVSKLADRGSTQVIGVVTDAALFLSALNRELDGIEA